VFGGQGACAAGRAVFLVVARLGGIVRCQTAKMWYPPWEDARTERRAVEAYDFVYPH
jgi:hypothetical protein